jgi:protein TonB
MEIKKSKNVRIDNKRSTLLMIGLVCASSFTLMSFEYSNFQLKTAGLESDFVEEYDEDDWVYTPPKIEVKVQATVEEVNKEIIVVTPDPIPEPDPTPTPVPSPVPTPPLPPVPGPPMPPSIPMIDDHVYEIVEQMPEFPGGMPALYKFLGDNLKYPEISKDNGSEGKAYVRFTVEKDGTISGVEVIKGVDKFIDKEAMKVVKSMPNWKAGKQLNKSVRVSFVLPLDFKLEN